DRRRDHADPAQRQRGPAARWEEIPDGNLEDAPGAGRARPALRVAGLPSASRVVAGGPRVAVGAGREDRGQWNAIAVRATSSQAGPGLAAGAAARPPDGRPPAAAPG